jgi:hypothetical protein
MIYRLYTLVDITETKQRHDGKFLERSQQQNFDIVIQTLGLISNIIYSKSPTKVPASMFGQHKKTAWMFEWTVEREEVFEHNGDPVGRLKEVFNYVPIIDGLTEDVKLSKPMFKVNENIVFDSE